ncbi:hypothetical protein BDV29DRAFT_108588 [Aspergillus leporis]|uniref:Uncharacterized protein n=1 Tax=Aspergillus leporis TaxID=41062 RepID=A0A5N5X7T6_9EURO|nr:hypothetical protein BDV29DRAFT_108588 [Aspergillus leporis]
MVSTMCCNSGLHTSFLNNRTFPWIPLSSHRLEKDKKISSGSRIPYGSAMQYAEVEHGMKIRSFCTWLSRVLLKHFQTRSLDNDNYVVQIRFPIALLPGLCLFYAILFQRNVHRSMSHSLQ